MIPIEKIKNIKTIIVHENCPDGMASAMILHQVLPDAEIRFIQYDTEDHRNLVPTPGILFCDFSPHRDTAGEFLKAESIVLDHHAKAIDIVKPFVEAGLGAFGDEKADPGVCGAVLALREIWKPLSFFPLHDYSKSWAAPCKIIENLAALAGIRDTWQTKDPRWVEACEQAEALRFWPKDILLKARITEWDKYLELGPVVYAQNMEWAKKCADGAYIFTTKSNLKVAIVSGIKAISDAAEILGASVDIIIGFAIFIDDEKNQVMVLSCRSKSDFDCGAFCMAHGGGGHTKAAGCKIKLLPDSPQPYTLIQQVLEDYEVKL
jgi:hypothetical protein